MFTKSTMTVQLWIPSYMSTPISLLGCNCRSNAPPSSPTTAMNQLLCQHQNQGLIPSSFSIIPALVTASDAIHEIHKTCPSVAFHFMKKLFPILSGTSNVISTARIDASPNFSELTMHRYYLDWSIWNVQSHFLMMGWECWLCNLAWSLQSMGRVPFSGHSLHTL